MLLRKFGFTFIWLQEFENVEAEWPIFYLYMMLDGFFKVTVSIAYGYMVTFSIRQ